MKRFSNQTFYWQRLMIFLALNILLLVSYPSLLAARKAAQTDLRFEIEEEKTHRLNVSIKNECSEPHRFHIKSKIKYQPTDAILISAKSTEQLGVVFYATGLKSKLYRDKLIVECLDCKKGRGCDIKRNEFPFEMSVIKSTHQARPVVESVEWSSFAAVFSGFSETLAQLQQEIRARDEKMARLIQSIKRSTDLLKAKWESSPAPAPKAYLESLQMNLQALEDLMKSATGTEKKISRIQDVQLVHTGLDSYPVKSVLNQKTNKHSNTKALLHKKHKDAMKLIFFNSSDRIKLQ